MSNFDFITDEEFRSVLGAYKEEMHRCLAAQAWKSVHVLSGSIVEAVLLDYLVAEGHVEKEASLSMDLGTAVKMAEKEQIISRRASDLSSVIRDYRNLIHPGRSIRVGETPDENSAQVVVALLEMILGEIGGRKRLNYGYTAEQLVAKVSRDASVRGILHHLIADVNETEKERLLLRVIPEEYSMALERERDQFEQNDSNIMPMLTVLFRTTYRMSSDRVQARFVHKFVQTIKEESEDVVRTYCQEFFSMAGLKHLGPDDVQLVKEHYLDQLKSRRASEEWVRSLEGIGKFLSEDELRKFLWALVKIATEGGDIIDHEVVGTSIWDIYWDVGENMQAVVTATLDFNIEIADSIQTGILEGIKERVEIPF